MIVIWLSTVFDNGIKQKSHLKKKKVGEVRTTAVIGGWRVQSFAGYTATACKFGSLMTGALQLPRSRQYEQGRHWRVAAMQILA